MACSQVINRNAERGGEREKNIQQLAGESRAVAGGHQGGNGHGVERLVQDDGQRSAKTRQSGSAVPVFDGSCQHKSVQQRVQCQSQRRADPRELPRRFFRKRVRVAGMLVLMIVIVIVVMSMMVFMLMLRVVRVFLVAAIFRIAFRQVVMMEMKKALQEKHRQKAAQHPADSFIQEFQVLVRVGQKMEQGNTEHQAGNEADRDLQPGVGQPEENGQPTARQRREQHKPAINRQQPTGRNHATGIFNSARKDQPEKVTDGVRWTARNYYCCRGVQAFGENFS